MISPLSRLWPLAASYTVIEVPSADACIGRASSEVRGLEANRSRTQRGSHSQLVTPDGSRSIDTASRIRCG